MMPTSQFLRSPFLLINTLWVVWGKLFLSFLPLQTTPKQQKKTEKIFNIGRQFIDLFTNTLSLTLFFGLVGEKGRKSGKAGA
jgi:hypothetical protein